MTFARPDVSLLTVHGAGDDNVYVTQSERITAELRAKGAEAELVRLEGDEGNCHEECWKVARARAAIHRFLDRTLAHDGNRFYEEKHGARSPLWRVGMRPFLICIHDATPAYDRETREIIGDLAPLVGRRLSFGVVPNWHGRWPLARHPDYCRLVNEASEELLLHGYSHQRQRGWGPATWLGEGCDEMNGMDPEDTRRTLECGQRVFTDVFGKPARGFLAPGWQPGHVHRNGETLGLDHLLGFFSLESCTGTSIPLATWTWDCGRWGWLGHAGHGIGWMLQTLDQGVPVLAIHPRDLERGFWPTILRLTRKLLDKGYQPSTSAGLLEASDVDVAV